MIQTDLILQQILDQSQKENDNLLEIKKAIVESRGGGSGGGGGPGGGGGGGGGGSGDGNPPARRGIYEKLSDMLKRSGLGNGARDLTSTLTNNNMNGAQNAVRGFGAALGTAGNLIGMLPGPVGQAGKALVDLAGAAVKAYEWLDEQHKLYQSINESGVGLQDGFISLRKGAATSLMSVDQLSKAIKNNSLAFASMNGTYGNGVEHFGKLMNSVQSATNAASIYGVSQETLADITAKNFKMQKLYGMNSQLNDVNSTRSTVQFVDQLGKMSKVMGTSIDQLLKKVDDFMGGAGGIGLQAAFETMSGIPKELAGKMVKGLSTGLSSMGDGGKDLLDDYAKFRTTGIIDPAKWGSMTGKIADIFHTFDALGADMEDPEKVKKAADKLLTSDQDRQFLTQQMNIAQRSGNDAMAKSIANLLKYTNLASDSAAESAKGWDGVISKFNKWMGDIIAPISVFFNETLDSIGNWLLGIAEVTNSPMEFLKKMSADITAKFNEGVMYLFDKVIDIPMSLVAAIVGEDIAAKIKARCTEIFKILLEFPMQILNFVRDLLFGSSEQVQESVTAIKDSVTGFFGNILGGFMDLLSFDAGIDGVKKNISEAWDSMKSKVTGFWDTLKSWFGRSEEDPGSSQASQPTPKSSPVTASTKPKSQPVATPATAKPVAVQEPEKKEDPQTAQAVANANIDDVLRALNKVAQSSNKSNENLAALQNYLRTIASNTTPERNV